MLGQGLGWKLVESKKSGSSHAPNTVLYKGKYTMDYSEVKGNFWEIIWISKAAQFEVEPKMEEWGTTAVFRDADENNFALSSR